MLKSVGVVLSPVKMGVNTLEKPAPEIIKPTLSNNIDVTKKSWTFFKKSKSKLNVSDSHTNTIVASSETKPERILVDQEQQYDENDIPQYFKYEEKRLSYHPSQNLPSTSSNDSYNSSISSSFNKEKSRSCDVVFLNSQDPCYIQEESSSTSQNEQIILNNLNFNRNSLIIRDSLRNRIKIEISYNPTTINNNFDDSFDDSDNLSFVTAATSSNFRRNYRSNENGETILNINGFNDTDDGLKRNSIASSYDTQSNKNFMRRKLATQSRTLIPLDSSELVKEEWIQLEDDEYKENNNSNQVNINLVNPFTSAPNKSTNVVTINLNAPPSSKVQPIGIRKSQISLEQNSQPLNRSATLQSPSNSSVAEQRSQSTLENHRKHTPDLLSSRIDLFSILNRREDPLFDPSRNSISNQDDSSGKNFKFKKNSELRNTHKKLGSNIYSNNTTTSTNGTKRNSAFTLQNQLTLCDRLSGSFQNLSNKIKVNSKKMSASESNLVKLQQQELKKKSSKTNNMRHSDTFSGGYCPSVLFSKSKRNTNSKMENSNSLTATWRKFLPKIFKKKRVKSGRE